MSDEKYIEVILRIAAIVIGLILLGLYLVAHSAF